MATETMRLGAKPGSRFWKTRRDRVASALLALLLALFLGFFVLGRGPGTLIWLTGSRLSWLPFVGAGLTWLPASLDWLPLGAKANGTAAGPSTSGGTPLSAGQAGNGSTGGSATPPASHGVVAGAFPTPTPQPGDSPTPRPSGTPITPGGTGAFPTPTPILTLPPTPSGTSLATPDPTATPTPIPTLTAVPTATPVPTPTPTPFAPVLLYSDNFQSDVALGLLPPSGWTNEPAGLIGLGGYTVAVDGSNVLKGPAGNTGYPTAVAGSAAWTDYTVEADIKVDPNSGHARLVARHQSAGNFYACGLDAGSQLFLGKETAGAWSTLASNGYSFKGTIWYHIAFSVQGNSLTCAVTEPGSGHSGTLTATATSFSSGSIGATGEYGAEYDNFTVNSLP